jgi:hypothetical protein
MWPRLEGRGQIGEQARQEDIQRFGIPSLKGCQDSWQVSLEAHVVSEELLAY